MTIMRSILVGEVPPIMTSFRVGAARSGFRTPVFPTARGIATGRVTPSMHRLVIPVGVSGPLRLYSVGIRGFATGQSKPPATPAAASSGTTADSQETKKVASATAEAATPSASPPTVVESKPKLSMWEKFKKECKHYWDGTKLLGYEVNVSFKLVMKMASGRELTRREDRQLKRTVQDMGRLVPFSVFVIVPFAEFLLPFALKLFPNLLPSTYESKSGREKRLKTLGKTRGKVGTYLKDMVNDAKIVPRPKTEEQKQAFDTFMAQVKLGERPDGETTLKVAQLFKDDMLLDNFSRHQLAALARYMNMTPIGTSTVLRYSLRHRMRQIKQDDYIIDREGVDSLNSQELQNACLSRGFKVIGVSIGRQRSDLSMWLQLRLKDRVPSTILVLSSAYTYGSSHDLESFYDGVTAVLSALPSEVYHEAELEVDEVGATNEQRLEVLKEQQDKIMEENKENEESGQNIQVRDNLNVDEPADAKNEDVLEEQPQDVTRAERARDHPVRTESEQDVKADQNPVDPIRTTQADKLRRNPPRTESELSVDADQEADRLKPRTQPTASEQDVDADRSPVDPLAEKRREDLRRNPPRTDSEQAVDADHEKDPLKGR